MQLTILDNWNAAAVTMVICCSMCTNPACWGYEPHFLISCKLYRNSNELCYL